MKFISFDRIANIGITPKQCVEWVEDALRLKDASQLPHKISLKPEGMDGVFYNTMPSIIPGVGAGVKLVTRYPDRKPALDSQIMFCDLETGECLAILDGDWITAMRTGAVAAHSIKLLAKDGFSSIGIMGLGNTARATLLCLADIIPDRLEVGLLRYKDQAEDFVSRFDGYSNLDFHVVDDARELAEENDVLVSCITVTDDEIAPPESFAPGALLVPVHTRGFAACDLAFDKVFCDDESHVSGFGYYPQFKVKLTEVADVVTGKKPGRESQDERILAYNIGVSLHDIYYSRKIYDLIGEDCPALDLKKPEQKFWV